MQKWDVRLPKLGDSKSQDQRIADYVLYCQRWQDQLLNTPHLTTLSLGPNVLHPPLLGNHPLRHLELRVKGKQPWLTGFLEDLRQNATLESLTILSASVHGPLPKLQLEGLKSLRHVKLRCLLPTGKMSLPKDCLLHLNAWSGRRCEWEKHSRGIERYTAVLHMAVNQLIAWPADIQRFTKLQCLAIELPLLWWLEPSSPWPFDAPPLDLAGLQHIPHVKLINCAGGARLSAGSWQSLEIRGFYFVDFSDLDAFVKGTNNFIFEFEGSSAVRQATMAAIRNSCRKNHVCFYEHQDSAIISTAEKVVQACARRPRAGVYKTRRNMCLWDEDTFWPSDPLAALG